MFREANFFASSALYFLCGFIWIHNGTLRGLRMMTIENRAHKTIPDDN